MSKSTPNDDPVIELRWPKEREPSRERSNVVRRDSVSEGGLHAADAARGRSKETDAIAVGETNGVEGDSRSGLHRGSGERGAKLLLRLNIGSERNDSTAEADDPSRADLEHELRRLETDAEYLAQQMNAIRKRLASFD